MQLRDVSVGRTLEPMHAMRIGLLMLLLVMGLSAQRQWSTGSWDTTSAGREYILEGKDEFLTVELEPSDVPFNAVAGTTVQYAVDQRTISVRDGAGAERSFRVIKTAAKYSNDYSAVGGGHFIKAVSADGSRVTLEDGSRWDMDPRAHFSVAEWQADDLVTIRRSADDPDFPFNVSNTSRDDGAVAKHLAR